MDLARSLQGVVPPAPTADGGDRAPPPYLAPLADSASERLEFTVGGTRYTAVGFHTQRSAICVALTETGTPPPSGNACLRDRLLADALERQPAHLFAAGGGARGMVHTGFARADVTRLTPVEDNGETTVILSEPWNPEPWTGDPIRFFFVFEPGARPAPVGSRASPSALG